MIQFLGSAFRLYPIDPVFGMIWSSETQGIALPKQSPICEEWGMSSINQFHLEDDMNTLRVLDSVYLSIIERTFYSIEYEFPYQEIECFQKEVGENGELQYDSLILGLTPYGGIALWMSCSHKTTLLRWLKGEVINLTMEEYLPHDPIKTLDEYCDAFINADKFVKENLRKNGLPPHDLFDNYMRQFTYRYLQVLEKWDKDKERWLKYEEGEVVPEFDYIEEALYDGTHDKLHDGGLMKYHQAGKPKKLRMQWHIKKSEYTAYFWFEDERIREVFDKFYGAHPDTKTDFIIRIDAERRKYELALYRYGLKEPQIIPEDVYQLLVFKNKFEDYRSENYNQERGAWIW